MSVVAASVTISAGLVASTAQAATVTASVGGQPGTLDTSFNSNGFADLGIANGDPVDGVVVEPDGDIVSAAVTGSGVTVFRLKPDGTLDTGFGTGGKYLWAGAGYAGEFPKAAIAEDNAGNVYVTSSLWVPNPDTSTRQVAVLRLTSGGVPDAAWHADDGFVGDGVRTHYFQGYPNDHGTSLAVDETRNRLYVGAWQGPDPGTGTATDFTVLAYTISGPGTGLLDEVFGNSGIATHDFNGGNDTTRDIALMPDGRVLAAGYVGVSNVAHPDDTGLWMINPDGSTDTSFGVGGTKQVDFSHSHGDDGARSVTVDGDGHIYVSGTNHAAGHGFVAAFKANGDLDTTFNRLTVGGTGQANAGELPMDFGAGSGASAGLTTASEGRVVAVGQGGSSAGVARFVNERYASDTVFGPAGARSLSCSGTGGASGVARQSDDSLVIVGSCAGDVRVWRVFGGTQITSLPSPPSAATAGSPMTADGFSTNGSGNQVTVAPGADVTMSFTYHLPGQPCCAIDQLVTGFVNTGPSQCFNFGVPTSGANGNLTQTFTAPTAPGHYYVAMSFGQWYGCSGGSPGNESWELGFPDGGKVWNAQTAPNIASYMAEVTVSGASAFGLTSGGGTIAAGAHTTPVADIPLDALTGSLADLAAAPLRGSPLRGSPLRGSDLAGSPLRGSPLRGSPLRGSPLRGSPLRGSPIPLSDVPLNLPNTWAAVLTGTVYAGQPLQNVTLQQVLALDPAPAAVSALSLADIDLSRTPLRNVSLVAFLLGNTPVSALLTAPGQPGNLPSGTDTTQSLIGLELAGVDLSHFYSAGVHVRGHTLTDAPLSGIRLADMWLAQTPLGDVNISSVPASWVNCASGCTTLADVQQQDVDHGFNDVATLGAYFATTGALDLTLGQLLPGLLPRDELPYAQVGTDTIAAASPLQGPFATYSASFSLNCSGTAGTGSVTFSLPPGFRYKPGSATFDLSGVSGLPAPTVTTPGGTVKVEDELSPCTDGTHAGTATIKAEAGTVLGPTTATASLSLYGATASASDADPVTVVSNPSPTTMTAPATSTLYLGHVGTATDQDRYTLPDLAPGTTLTVTLSHVPAGQDFDLSVFGPGVPPLRSAPLRGSPLRGSPLRGSGVDDTTLDPTSDGTSAPPEPQTDVPIEPPAGDTVWGISDNRGDVDESVSTLVPAGTTAGGVTIVVSGYNGSSSPLPFGLLVSVVAPPAPPPCAAPNFPFAGQGSAGTAPTTIASSPARRTLILTDKKRLGDLYGTAAADNVMSKLATLAARDDVRGVVASVESATGVQAAYDAWDAHPCSPAAANAVVTAINSYVDSIRGDTNDLRNIVIAGGDLVVPMARVRDHIDLDNEQTYANDEVYSNQDNPLSAALRAGDLLTDDPYGDFNPISWLDGQAFVPDVAMGRLVETPTDIAAAVDAFVASGGVRTANAAYTAGYDFNSDGAQQVADALAGRVPLGTAQTSINGTWTKTDAVDGLNAAAHGYLSVNAHYDAYRALPASEFTAGTQNQLLTTANLPASLSNGTFFTIGCHAGLSVADTFVSLSSETARKADWPQAVASKGGISAANTGYGYGDSVAVAYSEQLMASFARNLNGTMSVGQALMMAKQSYLHLPLAAVDAKVMEEATFYGLPMYRIGNSGTTLPSMVPAAPAPAGGNVSESVVKTASFGPSATRDLVARNTGRGVYYVVKNNATGAVEAPLSVPNRPLEPLTTDPAAPAQDSYSNLVPHGVLVTGLTTRLVAGTIDPVYSSAVPDGSSLDPEPTITDAFFPATFAGLLDQGVTPTGPKTVVQLNPGQFRSLSGGTQGFQQLTDQIQYKVLYSNSDDVTPPSINSVTGVVSGTGLGKHVTFTVQASDTQSGVAKVDVLFLESPATNTWQRVSLNHVGSVWTADAAVSADTVQQYLVQATDGANNVATSSSKGQDFRAETAPVSGAPAVTLTGHQAGNGFDGPVTVTLTGTGSLTYSLDGNVVHSYSGPFTVSALTPSPHQLVAFGVTGARTERAFSIVQAAPTVTLTSPADGATYVVGQSIPATYSCTNATSCTSSPATVDTSPGVHTFTVNGSGPGGSASASATYTVGWRFVGFLQPVNDPPGASVSVFKLGSTIPIKFQLVDVNGGLISDAAANALVNACQAQIVTTRVGTLNAPVDETVTTAASDAGSCFRYDATADQFIYNLSTKTLTGAASGDAWRIRAIVFAATPPSTNRSADHSVVVGLK